MFVDSDDCWCNNQTLSSLANILEKSDVDLLDSTKSYSFTNVEELSDNNFTDEICIKCVTPIERLTTINSQHLCAVWLSCYRRKWLESNRIYFAENVYYEDTDFRLKCIVKANSICMVNIPFYAYRNNPNSTVNTLSSKLQLDSLLLIVRLLDWINTDHLSTEIYNDIVRRTYRNIIFILKCSHKFQLKDSIMNISTIKPKYREIVDKSKFTIWDRVIYTLSFNWPYCYLAAIKMLYKCRMFLSYIKHYKSQITLIL